MQKEERSLDWTATDQQRFSPETSQSEKEKEVRYYIPLESVRVVLPWSKY